MSDLTAFKPDYICHDPECPSRKILRDMVAEYQGYIDGAIEAVRARIAEAEGCPSEQQESCELGDVCECREKARREVFPEISTIETGENRE